MREQQTPERAKSVEEDRRKEAKREREVPAWMAWCGWQAVQLCFPFLPLSIPFHPLLSHTQAAHGATPAAAFSLSLTSTLQVLRSLK